MGAIAKGGVTTGPLVVLPVVPVLVKSIVVTRQHVNTTVTVYSIERDKTDAKMCFDDDFI